jgi:hypothetical protein
MPKQTQATVKCGIIWNLYLLNNYTEVKRKFMKHIKTHISISLIGILVLLGALSCSDSWDNYYTANVQESDGVEIYQGDIKSYISSQSDLTSISTLFTDYNIYDSIHANKEYTVIVTTNEVFGGNSLTDEASFAKNCVSDIAISPSEFTDGRGILTRLGKNIWISKKENGDIYFDDYKLEKLVKTSNGFIYYVNGLIPVRQSIYNYFESLGDNYSVFKSLIKRYEEVYFDPDKSTPISVDAMGNTVYDTVMTTRNILIDRYSSNGLKTWDMFSEDFLSTMFIPSNKLINDAIDTALSKIPLWLNRAATVADRTKFEEWIVRACFVNRRLDKETVAPTAQNDFYCIDGYLQEINVAQDVKTYEPVDPAVWRPSVQKSDINGQIKLSNGFAYYLTSFKIPNHIVIYRVKSKFYELWGAMTDPQKTKYFRWSNWDEEMIVNDAQSSFTLSETLPTMYYHVLTAIPSASAIADSAECSVTYDGLLYNSTTRKLAEVHLPAGEYNLRMGFKHSLRYSISIYFNNELLVKDMLLAAQGSNFHFDRGSVSDMDYYGNSSIGFPEGFDWRNWIEKDVKAVAYDTDGYQVAVINIPEDGNFTITISSGDDSYLYNPTNGRSKNNVTQLMMYHWCLRPTTRNY